VPAVKYILLLTWFSVVLFGMAAVAVWWAVVTFGRGEYLTVVVTLAFAASCAAVPISLSLIMLGEVVPRATFDAGGTTVRPDRRIDGLDQFAVVSMVIAAALFAAFHRLGRIDVPLPSAHHQYVVVSASVAALAGISQVVAMFARGGLSFQKLTPLGFELGQGLSSVRGEWDDVVLISDRRPGKEPPFRSTLFVKFRNARTRSQAIDSYTPGGDALRRLVRYYWINPEARGELTDGRAVERLNGLLDA